MDDLESKTGQVARRLGGSGGREPEELAGDRDEMQVQEGLEQTGEVAVLELAAAALEGLDAIVDRRRPALLAQGVGAQNPVVTERAQEPLASMFLSDRMCGGEGVLALEERHQAVNTLDGSDLGTQLGKPGDDPLLQRGEPVIVVQHGEALGAAMRLQRIGALGQRAASGLGLCVHGCPIAAASLWAMCAGAYRDADRRSGVRAIDFTALGRGAALRY